MIEDATASAFVEKPCRPQTVRQSIAAAHEARRLRTRNVLTAGSGPEWLVHGLGRLRLNLLEFLDVVTLSRVKRDVGPVLDNNTPLRGYVAPKCRGNRPRTAFECTSRSRCADDAEQPQIGRRVEGDRCVGTSHGVGVCRTTVDRPVHVYVYRLEIPSRAR